MRVRSSMKKARGSVDGFAASARQVMYCRLMGLDTASAYRSPGTAGLKAEKLEKPTVPKNFKAPDPSRFSG